MSKFDIRTYNEDAPNKETRKDQKIRHQSFDKRTGRIPQESKTSHRIQKVRWEDEA